MKTEMEILKSTRQYFRNHLPLDETTCSGPTYILYQYISSFQASYYIDSSLVSGRLEFSPLKVKYDRFRNRDEGASRNTHNKRSLIRTSPVYHRRRTAGRNLKVEEYKHTHADTHTHTHNTKITQIKLMKKSKNLQIIEQNYQNL